MERLVGGVHDGQEATWLSFGGVVFLKRNTFLCVSEFMSDPFFLLSRTLSCLLMILVGLSNFSFCQNSNDLEYLVGTGMDDITRLKNGRLPHKTGTYGYVHYTSPYDSTKTDTSLGIYNGVHIDLKARAITIKHAPTNELFVYILFDLNNGSEVLRQGILNKLRVIHPDFPSANLMLAATHTHSAPGGYSYYMGYEVATPGFRPDIVEAIVDGAFSAIQQALKNQQPMQMVFKEAVVPDSIPIAFSRKALPAYNRNPEIKEPVKIEENYKATDRIWQMISFEKNGKVQSMLNIFAAHPNRMGSNVLCADTRGAASELAERELPEGGVALFSQNASGDIDDEGFYRSKVKKDNPYIIHPAYYTKDDKGKPHGIPRPKRVWVEGEYLKEQAFQTNRQPETEFPITGGIDCELIYSDMSSQAVPRGNYAETLDPLDYYDNNYFLLGIVGRVGSVFRPKMKIARTVPPTIGLGAIARIPDRLTQFVIATEKFIRYTRLFTTPFKTSSKSKYLWSMYRGQGIKTVMLEGNQYISAMGFPIGKTMFNIFTKFDPVLKELKRDHEIGLHDENTMYPTMVPIQIAIIGNIAIAAVSGEPGNIAGQRIEKTIYAHLQKRGVKRVIVNGHANENTGYIFTPEEYNSQFMPTQCGFVLYGKWTCPAFRYNFEQLAKAMLQPKNERDQLLDYSIQPPQFSDNWYEKASYLDFLEVER